MVTLKSYISYPVLMGLNPETACKLWVTGQRIA